MPLCQGLRFVKDDLDFDNADSDVSVFELTIRAHGGPNWCFRAIIRVPQQRLKNPIDYPIGTPVGSYKVTEPLLVFTQTVCHQHQGVT